MKKLVSLVLALAMILTIGAAFAADPATTTPTGSVTISNAEVDAEYSLYKLFDATVAADGKPAYLLPAGKNVSSDTFFNTYFTVGAGNYITAKDTFTEAVLKTADFKTWATGFGTQVGSTIKATNSTVTWNNVPYGYYYVTSTVGGVLTVDSVNPNVSVIDKNQTNKSSKVIVDNGKEADVNEAGINEVVNFKISDKVKNYNGENKVYQYMIDDQLDPAFAYNKSSLVVSVNGTTLAEKTTDNPNGKYTIAWDDTNNRFTITIPWTADGTVTGAHLYDNNSTIVVTYNAKLDPTKINADPSVLHYGTDANNNKARLRWNDDSYDVPTGDRPWDETETFDTALTITKVDGSGDKMTGAEFTLTSTNGTKVILVTEYYYAEDANGTHWKLKDDTYTTEAPNGNANHDAVYANTETKYALKSRQIVKGEGQTNTTVSSFVGDDGTVTFTGLAVGTYKIEETVVPAGYNKAADIEFEITFDPQTKAFASSNDKVVLNGTTNTFKTTIENKKGTELPSTGGIGTTIFYILGGLLVVGAAVILVARRRVKE